MYEKPAAIVDLLHHVEAIEAAARTLNFQCQSTTRRPGELAKATETLERLATQARQLASIVEKAK